MITRFAFFEGTLKEGSQQAFEAFAIERLAPVWKQFTGASEVRVMFSQDRDEGAPEFPLILAISYPDLAAMDKALESDARAKSKELTGEMVDAYFDGKIHHHVTTCNHFDT
ncbi:MAG: hypothetical protein AB8B49_02785 [Nitratireductor sp.]